MHDAWASYDTYPQLDHALCNAHALRELAAVTELASGNDTGEDEATAGQWCWATQIADALRELNILINHTESPDPVAVAEQVRRYHDGVVIGTHATRARASKLERRHHALARRLRDRQGDYLRFVTDDRVPIDNNAGERDQAAAEGVRVSAHPHWSRAVLRHPQLPRHHHEAHVTSAWT